MFDFIRKNLRTIFGIEILLHKNFKEAILLSFDKKLEHIMKSLVKKNEPVIFDVGANQGDSIDRYRKIFPFGMIYSFEPNIKLYDLIKNKYSRDKNVYIYDLGISDKTDNSKLNVSSNHLMSSIEEINYDSEFFKKEKLQLKRLWI